MKNEQWLDNGQSTMNEDIDNCTFHIENCTLIIEH